MSANHYSDSNFTHFREIYRLQNLYRYAILQKNIGAKRLNNRIKQRRKELKMAQSELAMRIGGVSRQ